MRFDLEDQLHGLGVLLDELVAPVTTREIVAGTEPHEQRSLEEVEISANGPTSGSPRGLPGFADAAIFVLVVAALAALAMIRDTGPASDNLEQSVPTTARRTLATLSPDEIPAGSTLRATSELPIGIIDIYDDPTGLRTCFVWTHAGSAAGGCVENTAVASGRDYNFFGDHPGIPGVLFGIASTDIGFHATVGDDSVTVDGNGVWYATVPSGTKEFTLSSNSGSTVIQLAGVG